MRRKESRKLHCTTVFVISIKVIALVEHFEWKNIVKGPYKLISRALNPRSMCSR